MANDKKFVVRNGLQANNIAFVNEANSAQTITASMLSSKSLSFSGNSGQLFSITDTMTGVIYAVNDVSGIPSIEVDDTGDIRLAELSGNVSIGTALDTHKLFVNGNTFVNSTFTVAGITTTSAGANAITFTNATSNYLMWNTAGVIGPSATTRSAGTKVVLYPAISSVAVDYALGIENGHMWFSAGDTSAGFKWYSNTVNIMTANTTGLNLNTRALSGVTTAAMGNTSITGFVNATASVNSAILAVGTSFIANSTQTTYATPVLLNNQQQLRFQTVNTSAYAYFTQQNDDNFVFYTSNTTYGARAVLAIFANSITSNLQTLVPFQPTSGIVANSSLGSSGQVLKTNGSTVYWDTAGGTGTVTSVSSGNGLTGGPITATGTLSVVAGTDGGLVSNSTGVWVSAGSGLLTNSTGLHVGSGNGIATSADAAYVSGGSTLTVNATGVHVNSALSITSLTLAGALSGVTTAAMGNTTITGFANVAFGSGGGLTGPSSGSWAGKIVTNQDTTAYNGLSVQNRWAAATSVIFEAAMGWNGTAAGYYPVFTVDGLGQVTINSNAPQAFVMGTYANGNVGFGNSAPAHKVSINGTSYFGGVATYAANVSITAGSVLNWNNDVGISRSSASTLSIGNGTNNDSSGQLNLAKIYLLNGNITSPSTGIIQFGTGATSGTGAQIQSAGASFSANVVMANNNITRPVLTGYTEAEVSNTAATGTWTMDCGAANFFDLTLTGNITISPTNVPPSTRVWSGTIAAKQDATGGRTITWPTGIKWPGGSAPPATTTANAIDIWSLMTYDGGSTWVGSLTVKNVA